MMKRYAKLATNADGLLVKTAGYLVREGDTPPEGSVEINADQEKKLNNGFYVADQATMELKEIPPHVTTLAEAQASKIIELKSARDVAEVEAIEYNGHKYDYDAKARERITAAIIALDAQPTGTTIVWTCADNTDVTLTSADLKGIVAAVAVRSNSLHVKYRNKKTQVEACTTVEEVEKITANYAS